MRDSDFKSVSSNRAAVTITTSLYDRRALDATSDKPLVNSLNHLTYLVSSSAKVRETLSVDGGIERLVEILHECHNTTFNLNDTIFNSEKKLLTAWKWTLTFQCLVLVGTRGTERIRQKVVSAGILAIIATVLDNYLSLHERTFIHANSRPLHSHHYQVSQPCQYPSQQAQLQQARSSQSSRHAQSTSQQQQQQQQQHSENPLHLYHSHQQNERNQNNDESQHQQHQQHQQHEQQLPYQNVHTHVQSRRQQPSIQAAQAQRVRANQADSIAQTVNPAQVFGENLQRSRDENEVQTNDRNSFVSQELNTNLHSESMEFDSGSFTANSSGTGAENSSRVDSKNFSLFNASHPNSLNSDDYENLNVNQFFKLVGYNGKDNSINDDMRRKYLIVYVVKKLREERESDLLDDRFLNDNDYDMDVNLEFLSDLYLQDHDRNRVLINAKIAPRSFTDTGVVIPRDDDIVWSLQLLAYISKYPYFKETLQNTHLVIDMSIRDKQLKMYLERQMKLKMKKKFLSKSEPAQANTIEKTSPYVERFEPSASNSPQMVNGINALDSFMLDEDKLELRDKPEEDGLTEDAEVEDDSDEEEDIEVDECEPETNNVIEVDISEPQSENDSQVSSKENYLGNLYDSILNAESIVNDLEREITLVQLNNKVEKRLDIECKALSQSIINKRKESKQYLVNKWNYRSYNSFDVDGRTDDLDDSLVAYKKVNLFPMVEKFTFLTGTDMYYWSGVIMRNSCRRNEHRGGVRQCGNLECGKWEKFPRDFSKCRRCKRTKYCSRECQMKAWHCHRNWCIPRTSSTGTNTTTHTQEDASSFTTGDYDSQSNVFSEPS